MSTQDQVMAAFRLWLKPGAFTADPVSLLALKPGTKPTETGWVSPGSSREGCEIHIDTEWGTLSLDSYLRETGRVPTGGRVYVSGNLGEITIENISRVLNKTTVETVTVEGKPFKKLTQTAADVYDFEAVSVAFHGLTVGGKQLLFVLRQSLSVANLTLQFQKANQTSLAFEFTALEIDEETESFAIYGE